MNQTSENVNFLPMSLAQHDPKEVACLLYESSPELFTLMFGLSAIAYLTKFVQKSHNRYSHQYIQVAEINQYVVGIITLLPAVELNANADYDAVLNPAQRLWLKLVQRFLLPYVLQQSYPDNAFYIGNLAVVEACRNQGIGRQLLSQCIAEVANKSGTLFISVDVNNPRAQKLYESLGFRVATTKGIRLFGVVLGSRSLAWSIADESGQHEHHK
ncbi:MAG TPA: GNAT family N-acetyltransferase [Leptolyngbyaceae cyanobacterium M33_DOE_097]|uniref:N-acetyltransferase n=1 Tax=Oscillatoriales cyanobacterium SpSt-418 TaxID=2282169 RepID=A0A7C3PF13_9CYAN|nr:GNAT family N-acetyltransferase [Leptolyngbyaceae cyanobacterium M33_DOE_097]